MFTTRIPLTDSLNSVFFDLPAKHVNFSQNSKFSKRIG